jgi:anion-transporting  ArsA/GET3 family ATPase
VHCCVAAVIIANERRSESVQSAFVDLFSHSFTFKKVPLSKQDPDFSHQVIELWILKRKKGANDDYLREMEAAEQQQQQQGGDAVAEAGDPLQPLPPLQQQQEGGQQQQSSPRKQQPSDSSSGAAQLQADLTQLKLQGGGQ